MWFYSRLWTVLFFTIPVGIVFHLIFKHVWGRKLKTQQHVLRAIFRDKKQSKCFCCCSGGNKKVLMNRVHSLKSLMFYKQPWAQAFPCYCQRSVLLSNSRGKCSAKRLGTEWLNLYSMESWMATTHWKLQNFVSRFVYTQKKNMWLLDQCV